MSRDHQPIWNYCAMSNSFLLLGRIGDLNMKFSGCCSNILVRSRNIFFFFYFHLSLLYKYPRGEGLGDMNK